MLSPSLLVAAYQAGYFPMAMDDGEIRWYSPDPRGVLPLDRFHAPRRLLRTVRSRRFEISVDRAFRDVMEACAADREDGTWINEEILASYGALHEQGLAHSVEIWAGGELAGGLYGVCLGGAFFGESMFHRVSDASKMALWALVEHLRGRGFGLLDIQWLTPFLASCGAVEIPRDQYLEALGAALDVDARF
ncbi:MAG TPA: leucyl/phenylalanyl-tRNA--protein transferase [Vicinamibacterales bacterium]|nr:leucyl/phenylalanyl-tRNA--protein transferase [Vicinamibacterales bacterium]